MVSRVKHQESNASNESAQHTDDEEYPPSYESVVYGSIYAPPYSADGGHVSLADQQSTSSADPEFSTADWTTQLISPGSSTRHKPNTHRKQERSTHVRYSTVSGTESVQIELRTDTGDSTSGGALLDSDSDLEKRPASYMCFSFAVCLFCNPCFGCVAIICACLSSSSTRKGDFALAEAQGTKAFWIGAAGIFITFTVVTILILTQMT